MEGVISAKTEEMLLFEVTDVLQLLFGSVQRILKDYVESGGFVCTPQHHLFLLPILHSNFCLKVE
jgi:hypothetical protein